MRKFFNLAAVLGTLAASAAFGAAVAQEPKSIKVGYAISLSGPQAAGAMLTTVPNYRLWVDDVNKAGGLMLKKYNKRIPLELVEVDDRSDNQDMVRQVERMMSVDKLDIVLSPWGTGPNLQAAPTFAKFGYPQIMGTAGSDKLEDFVQKFPTMFWFLSKPNEQIKALVDLLADQKGKGKINDTVAVFVVQHPFGVEYSASLKPALASAGFKVVYETSYALGVADLSAQINAAKAANPDSLIAISYPPDTFMITEQSIANGFTPKVRFLGVGSAFPNYKGKFGDKVNGILGLGGFDPAAPGMKDYFDRHKAVNKGQEPDRWASPNTYAGLQVLQQAIETVGEIDREKIIAELKTGTFKTVLGDMKLDGNRLTKLWWVGQWQDGEYKGIAPASLPGATAPVIK